MRVKKTINKMNAEFISESLKKYYDTGAKYMVPNIYFFGDGYGETDLLVVRDGKHFIYDIEIKVSRADYKNDFKKKDKHLILEKGYRTFRHRTSIKQPNGKRKWYKANEPVPIKSRPNRFFFAVPEGLIKPEELPSYAGLLYITKSGKVKKIKEGKLLHKETVNHAEKLCRKFYFYWLNAEERVKTILKTCD